MRRALLAYFVLTALIGIGIAVRLLCHIYNVVVINGAAFDQAALGYTVQNIALFLLSANLILPFFNSDISKVLKEIRITCYGMLSLFVIVPAVDNFYYIPYVYHKTRHGFYALVFSSTSDFWVIGILVLLGLCLMQFSKRN